jgi:hypothetical protein
MILQLDNSCFETFVNSYSATRIDLLLHDIKYQKPSQWKPSWAVNLNLPNSRETLETFSLAYVEVANSNLDLGYVIHVSFFIPSRQANAWYKHTFDCKIRGSHNGVAVGSSSEMWRCVVGWVVSGVSKGAFEILELLIQRHSVKFQNSGIFLIYFREILHW